MLPVQSAYDFLTVMPARLIAQIPRSRSAAIFLKAARRRTPETASDVAFATYDTFDCDSGRSACSANVMNVRRQLWTLIRALRLRPGLARSIRDVLDPSSHGLSGQYSRAGSAALPARCCAQACPRYPEMADHPVTSFGHPDSWSSKVTASLHGAAVRGHLLSSSLSVGSRYSQQSLSRSIPRRECCRYCRPKNAAFRVRPSDRWPMQSSTVVKG
jgi:hypothetical protein